MHWTSEFATASRLLRSGALSIRDEYPTAINETQGANDPRRHPSCRFHARLAPAPAGAHFDKVRVARNPANGANQSPPTSSSADLAFNAWTQSVTTPVDEYPCANIFLSSPTM